MSIKYNGAQVSMCIANYQPTDFSKVTAHPEFVLRGKTFYDETGQLKHGTAALEHEGESGGTDTSDATATAGDVLAGATFYAQGTKKTGTIKKINDVAGGVSLTAIKNDNPMAPAGDIIVSYTSDQKVCLTEQREGFIGHAYDENLAAENIKSGVTILGVTGTHEGELSGRDIVSVSIREV